MNAAMVILALVVSQRLIEVVYATHNTRALMARGAIEIGRKHHPLFILLHGSWLVAMALALPADPVIRIFPLVLFVLFQMGRLWVIISLGPYWTTRIITLPGAPLVKHGPYRWFRHPNYAVVVGEFATLPLVFDQIGIAIMFSLLNAALLTWRIREENHVLAQRAGLP